ncbi:MAG: HAD family hydrolase [Calditrichia bacterium]
MNSPKAIIFDMDGLLIDSERLSCDAWIEAAGEWGYEMSDETYGLVIGRTVREAERVFSEFYGEDFPFYDIREKRVQLTRAHYAKHGVPIKSGVSELLQLVDKLKLPRAVATSTSHKPAHDKLEKTGLRPHFHAVVTGDEIANGKPAPDIFLLAAQRINANPTDCMVLEDSEAGIKAAHTAGMTPIMVPDIKMPDAETRKIAAHVMPSLHEVRQLINDLFSN